MSQPAFQRDDYTEFCEGVRRLTGIDLAQYKRPQMERRIRSFADRRGIAGLPEYLVALSADRDALEGFLDRMTINVSQLWRNPEQWDRLGTTILPELARTGTIRAWSAGSSYGAEAYTLAAICRRVAPGCKVEIRGTDIDARMVARAREGRFSADDARTVPRAELERAFDRDGDGWRARPELRMMVRFAAGDLLRDPVSPGAYDLVLCRNVVIYFTEPVRDALHRRLATALRPGGYLMVGSSERVSSPQAFGLATSHPFIYRKS
ncbi:MAG TPA: protein-glutamate O-methyltransferase CheR [Gaiellales bacterium]|jgi:chemotaxis protein methyltransferase CheR|nr:protein-glutamate O-methyltransferase CheR [Gaiellales bacterium]